MRGKGAIPVLETAYDFTGTDEDWLDGLLEAANQTLGEPGYPIYGAVYQSHQDGFDVLARRLVPENENWLGCIDRLEKMLPRRLQRVKFTRTVAGSSTELARGFHAPAKLSEALYSRVFPSEYPFADVLQLVGCDTDDVAVGITACYKDHVRLSPRARETWTRVSVHLAHSYRLRRALRSLGKGATEAADAVLDMQGRPLHLADDLKDTSAQKRLFEAVEAISAARGSLSNDKPDDAVGLWKGLVDGTWSVVQHFDTDRKAYLLAVKNSPAVAHDKALTRRERQVVELAARGDSDQIIAYALGMSTSTARTHLARAVSKLGVRNRIGLIRSLGVMSWKNPLPEGD